MAGLFGKTEGAYVFISFPSSRVQERSFPAVLLFLAGKSLSRYLSHTVTDAQLPREGGTDLARPFVQHRRNHRRLHWRFLHHSLRHNGDASHQPPPAVFEAPKCFHSLGHSLTKSPTILHSQGIILLAYCFTGKKYSFAVVIHARSE